MPPNQEESIDDGFCATDQTLQLTPMVFITPPSSEETSSLSLSSLTISSIDENSSFSDRDISLAFANIFIPVEQNLRELLCQVTDTDDLRNVTRVKLRVIARDVSLQHLSVHTPLLSELILDGSVITSLRDIGCSLRCLRVLSVNRCCLTCFDGLFGLETLEELSAGHNEIEDVSPCSHLPRIKLIDVNHNRVRRFASVTFLSLCDTLRHLIVAGNLLEDKPNYRHTIKQYLPKLLTLDGKAFDNKEEANYSSLSDDDSDMDDYNQNLNVCISEIRPIELEERNVKSISSLPPIVNAKKTARPATANISKRPNAAKKLTRPHTASSLKEDGIGTQLPGIPKGKKQPSSLTSGEPICGNIAVSLRNRSKIGEAWMEH